MQTKQKAIKELEEKAINKAYENIWSSVINLLTEEEQHEYYWLVEGICIYDNTDCIDCNISELEWSKPQQLHSNEFTNEHYMFTLYIGMVF